MIQPEPWWAKHVALVVAAGVPSIVTVVGRWLSHREHKETKKDVQTIKDIVLNGNGKDHSC